VRHELTDEAMLDAARDDIIWRRPPANQEFGRALDLPDQPTAAVNAYKLAWQRARRRAELPALRVIRHAKLPTHQH
jgi:hypothetical protein